MNLELRNVTTVQVDGASRIVADLTAPDYVNPQGEPFACSVSCWGDLIAQWTSPVVAKYLVKEGISGASAKLAEKKALAAVALATAQALPDGDETKAAQVTAAQDYVTLLTAFEADMTAEIPIRVNSFYTDLKAKYVADGNQTAADQVQAEWDAWSSAQVDPTGLEGPVPF